ncbi:MAG: hypothetical protein E2576_11055 [Alcaligenaceae bacterium]|nr:hypothetical protein [Alcaligenaceae bacterium SAGV5]MPS51254.1 hypothetical protein [Alcaligenaceae bacterium SAGV3]MPT57249.1 hypothetical protein [Alcaligenaceae bacterium]
MEQPPVTKPSISATEDDASLTLQYEVTAIVRERTGLHETQAGEIAAAVIAGLSARYGGDRLYVPVLRKEQRNAAILQAFDGTNRAEICRRFGISQSTLYKILKRRRCPPP